MKALRREDFRMYNMSVQFYGRAQTITVQRGCFAFMFTNVGDTTASINEMVIFPNANPATGLGDSRTISGHLLDLYTGFMNLSFVTPQNANPRVEVVQLYYISEEV